MIKVTYLPIQRDSNHGCLVYEIATIPTKQQTAAFCHEPILSSQTLILWIMKD